MGLISPFTSVRFYFIHDHHVQALQLYLHQKPFPLLGETADFLDLFQTETHGFLAEDMLSRIQHLFCERNMFGATYADIYHV